MEDIKMKKLFTLLFSLTILSASASRGFSELNVKLFDNSAFSVVMDNISYNYYTSSYNFSNLVPGDHSITVTKYVPSDWWNGTLINKIIFSGNIVIPSNVKIFSMVASNGGFVILSQIPLLGADDSHYVASDSDPASTYNGAADSNENPGTYSDGTSAYYFPCMSEMSFMSLISVINSSSFESSKIQIAKQAINTNYFKAQQVRQLLNLFTFESSKLEIAKLAYVKTIDKNNFFLVNDAFTFESSIEELNQFIVGS